MGQDSKVSVSTITSWLPSGALGLKGDYTEPLASGSECSSRGLYTETSPVI